jgi:diguanylate cyclase
MSEVFTRLLRRRRGISLVAYLAVDLVMIGAATGLSARGSWLVVLMLIVLGAGAFALGVWRQRPEPPLAWRFLVAGAVSFAAIIVIGVFVRLGVGRQFGWTAVLLVVVPSPLFVVGLALLARLGRRLDAAVTVDALLLVSAAYLVLFAAVIRPHVGTGWDAAVSILSPLGAFLVLAMIIRIIFAGGVPTLSVALLLLALGVRACGAVALFVPAIATSGFRQVYDRPEAPTFARGVNPIDSPVLILWLLYGILIGVAGLHPSLARTRRRAEGSRWVSAPLGRIVLVAALAVSVIFGWLLVAGRAPHVLYSDTGFAIPVGLSAVVLVLLVIRVGLAARAAYGRAGDLAEQSVMLAGRTDELAKARVEQELLQQEMHHRATHDLLTGLCNRTALTERMASVMNRAARPQALALLDLDAFKDINDVHGYAVGDELLIQVSHRLTNAVPEGGTLARIGGDEFAVLLEDTSETDALALANDLRDSLRRPYRIGEQELFVSASIGLLTAKPGGERNTPPDALRGADVALHAAKADGKDRVVVFHRDLESAQLNRTQLSMGLQRAITDNELSVEYQPICELDSFRIVAVEALLRWNPQGQAVPPAEFMPVAEETGVIGPIGEWVMRQSCRDARSWYHRHGIAAAVNVSARQLDDVGFSDMVIATLNDTGLPGRALIVEITETSLMTTTAGPIDQLRRLRDHGTRIAIDDFGTGYSSLASVSRLPVDIVKIDKSFVQQPGQGDVHQPDWAFVRAIIQMVKPLRLRTLAEGVERIEQVEALRGLGCPLGQGFLLGRPMPAERMDGLLSRSDTVTPHESRGASS